MSCGVCRACAPLECWVGAVRSVQLGQLLHRTTLRAAQIESDTRQERALKEESQTALNELEAQVESWKDRCDALTERVVSEVHFATCSPCASSSVHVYLSVYLSICLLSHLCLSLCVRVSSAAVAEGKLCSWSRLCC